MTKRDKILLLSSIILACLVIVTAFLAVRTLPGNISGDNELINVAVVALIIFISIVSVLFILYRIKKFHRGKSENLLNKDYYQHYEIIRDAIANSQLSAKQKKEIKDDILDLLVSAQKDEKDINKVIEDPAFFAREILKSFAKPSRFALLSFLDGIIWLISFIVGVQTVIWLENVSQIYFSVSVDLSIFIFFIFISFILIPVTKKLTSSGNPWMYMIPLAAGLAYVLLAEIARKYLYELNFIKWLLDGRLVLIPGIEVLMLYISSLMVVVIFKNIFRRRVIDKKSL